MENDAATQAQDMIRVNLPWRIHRDLVTWLRDLPDGVEKVVSPYLRNRTTPSMVHEALLHHLKRQLEEGELTLEDVLGIK